MEGMETTFSKLCPYVAHSGTGTMHSERCKEKRRTKIGERRLGGRRREGGKKAMYGKEDVIRGLIGTVSLNSDALLFLYSHVQISTSGTCRFLPKFELSQFRFLREMRGPRRPNPVERAGRGLPAFLPSLLHLLPPSLPPSRSPSADPGTAMGKDGT